MNSLHQNANTEIEPFESRIDLLFRELELAIKWSRPSTLFALYESDYVRAEAEAALAIRISEMGQQVFRVQLLPEGSDGPGFIPAIPSDRDDIVLFVYTPYLRGAELDLAEVAAANRSRDYLAEKNLRIVFWLREMEAVKLAQYSPDSWALRHRVVEFVDAPMSHEIIQCALDGARQDSPQCAMLCDDLESRINLGEALLNELPDQDQSTTVYAKLLLTLGILTWKTHDIDKSMKYLTTARDISSMLNDPQLQADCLIALGKIDIEGGKAKEALEYFEKANQLAPNHESLSMDLGNLYSQLGQHDRAIDAFLNAITYSPTNAHCWKQLGDVYLAQGRADSALAAFQRSLSLCPESTEALIGLGRAYAASGRIEEGSQTLREVLTREPENAVACLALGELLHQNRQTEAQLAEPSSSGEEEDSLPKDQETPQEPNPTSVISAVAVTGDETLNQSIQPMQNDMLETMDEEVHFSLGQYEKTESLVFPAALQVVDNPTTTTPPQLDLAETSAIPAHSADAESCKDDARTWNDNGHAHLEAGRYDAAIAAYIRAIELSQGSNWSYISNLTQAYYRKGQELDPVQHEDVSEAADLSSDSPQASPSEEIVEVSAAPACEICPDETLVSEPEAVQSTPCTSEAIVGAAIFAGISVAQLEASDLTPEINWKERAPRPKNPMKGLPKAYAAANLDPKLLSDAEHEDARFGLRRRHQYLVEDEESVDRIKTGYPQLGEMDFAGSAPLVTPTTAGALHRKPITAQEWLEDGNRLMRSGLYDEAIDCYNNSLALSPRSGGTFSNLALAYCYKEQYAEAIPLYQKSIYLLRSGREKAIAWNRLGDAYRRLNDQTSAAAAYRNAAQLYPGTNTLRTRARAALLSNATAP